MKHLKRYKLNESANKPRYCLVTIEAPFDSGFAEWAEDSGVFSDLGKVRFYNNRKTETVEVKCESTRLGDVIDMANSNLEGSLDENVTKITVTFISKYDF